ncbi:MAG: hypothetical protein AB1349_06505 [Elusimicrobiota bacterium]
MDGLKRELPTGKKFFESEIYIETDGRVRFMNLSPEMLRIADTLNTKKFCNWRRIKSRYTRKSREQNAEDKRNHR